MLRLGFCCRQIDRSLICTGIGGSLKGKCLTKSIPHWAPGVAVRKGDVQDGLMRRGRAREAAWSGCGLSRSCLGACLRAPGDELTALIKGTLGLRWDACVFSYPRVKAGDAESWERGAGCLCQCLIQMINGKIPEASRPAPWTCVSGHENPHVSTSWAR